MIKGVLFDKDGTLLDFGELWLRIAHEAMDELLIESGYGGDEKLRVSLGASIGLRGSEIDEKGYFASGTSLDMAMAFQRVLPKPFPYIHEWLVERVTEKTKHYIHHVQPTCNIKKLLLELKQAGVAVGLVTSDDEETTRLCLEALEIFDECSFIATAERYAKKPDPEAVLAFCEKFGLLPHEVAVVGDTVKDMELAQNSGAYGIGVLCGVGSREELMKRANLIVETPEEILSREGLILQKK